ncbi:MAG TPA: PilN domain-containing protein [Gaiellaceae bacterium]|jgi:Tfp pilus assembly protein PilN|nr:PilN domain-containing protein [Gaiellaceae bacterium]
MRAVNLLPGQDTGESKALPIPILAGCIGTVVVAAVLAMMFLSASSQVAKERSALQRLQAESAAIPAPPPPSPVVAQLPQQRQTRTTALATVLGQRVAWDRLLREVSQVVPSDVWLVTMNAQAPSTATPAAGQAAAPAEGFIVQGCTYSQDSVARFLARLALVPDLSGVTLGKSSSSSTSGGSDTSTCPSKMVSFQLKGAVRTAGASS